MARWIAATSRCKKEDGLDSGHPIPTRLTSSSFFFQFLPLLLSLGKGRGKRGLRRTQLTLLTSF